MKNLRQYIQEAEARNVAIGHFNISNLETLHGIVRAAKRLEVPVIIGTSEGEREFIGITEAVALVQSLRKDGFPIFLNADHTYSFEGVAQAVDAGYDAVIFDGAKLSLTENIEVTRRCVEYAKARNPELLVEGELGYIGTSSKLLDTVPEGAAQEGSLTEPDELKRFVEESGVDLIAPAVGNLHGMLKSGKNPNLNIERIQALRQAGNVPMVLHGGSGIPDADFTAAIRAGISVVHINTEIRVAYRKGLEAGLAASEEIAPYKFAQSAVASVEEVVYNRLALFNQT